MENFKLIKGWLRNAGLFTYSTGIAVIAFHVFIKHMAVIARRILLYAQMSLRVVLNVEGRYFSDRKNETKRFRDEIW
jgi:hypothetical protein